MVTPIYANINCYAWLRIVTAMVTHGYADLRGLLRMVTRIVTHGYAWLRRLLRNDTRGRNQMVTHGYAWLRRGQFADASVRIVRPPDAHTGSVRLYVHLPRRKEPL